MNENIEYLAEVGRQYLDFTNQISNIKKNNLESNYNKEIQKDNFIKNKKIYSLSKPSSNWRKGEDSSFFEFLPRNQFFKTNTFINKKNKDITEKVNNTYFEKIEYDNLLKKDEFSSNNITQNFNNYDYKEENNNKNLFDLKNIKELRNEPKYNKINFQKHEEIFLYNQIEEDIEKKNLFKKNKKEIKNNNEIYKKIENNKIYEEINKFNEENKVFEQKKTNQDKKEYPNPVLIEFNKSGSKITEKKRNTKKDIESLNIDKSKILEESYADKKPLLMTFSHNDNEFDFNIKNNNSTIKSKNSTSKIKKYINEDLNNENIFFKNNLINQEINKNEKINDNYKNQEINKNEKINDNYKNQEISHHNNENNDQENLRNTYEIVENFLNSNIMKKLFNNEKSVLNKDKYYDNTRNISSGPNFYNKKEVEFMSFNNEEDEKGFTNNFEIKEEYEKEENSERNNIVKINNNNILMNSNISSDFTKGFK